METREGRRSRIFEGQWNVPVGWTKPVPHMVFARQFIEKIEKMGWRFERAIKMYKDPVPVVTERGDLVDVWVLRALFSKPVRDIVLSVPDHLVPGLLAHPKLGPLITNVS